MEEIQIPVSKELSLTVYKYSDSGPVLHFYHANGFCANTYKTLLEKLSEDYSVYATDIRGHGLSDKPEHIHHWEDIARDLVFVLEQLGLANVIGVGHSLGGVTSMMAAVLRPGLFQNIIALDPVVFTKKRLSLIYMLKAIGLRNKIPPVASALRRRDIWPDRESIVNVFKRRAVFKDLNIDYLKNYAKYGFEEKNDEFHLRCPKHIEADIYGSIPSSIWKFIKGVSIPALVVRGENSDTLLQGAYEKMLKINKHIKGIELANLGHLFPMEDEKKLLEILHKEISLISKK